jgi:hypothetical protein
MSTLVADPLPASQVIDPKRLEELIEGIHLEPRCRVCRNDTVREKVNALLGSGATYRAVVRALGEDNEKLDKPDQVTMSSVRNHTQRHFPTQNVARATYRAILEERAKQNGVDFVNGVATALTPMAFFETIMVKSYEALTDPETKVDITTGMIAAGRLQAMIDSRASGTSIVEMRVQIGRVIDAVKSVVPEALWSQILQKINGDDAALAPPVDEEPDVFDPEDEPFDDDELDDQVNENPSGGGRRYG